MFLNILKIIPFVVLGLVILFGSHYFLYRSTISLFGLTRQPVKIALAAILFFLSMSFILASILAHYQSGAIAKYFYIATASWVGILINLTLAAGLSWLAVGLINLTGAAANKTAVAFAIFILALAFSSYGIWNAFHPKVKNIVVTIKNLPQEWQGKTAVQLSDIHLGYVHGVSFLQDIVKQTNALEPDLIFITGDLFDGMDGDLTVFVKILNDLRAAKGKFFVTGNHETYLGESLVLKILEQTDIKILKNELVNIDGLEIIGLAYPPREDSSSITGKLKNAGGLISSLDGFDKNQPSILLYHAPANVTEFKASGINLQLSGHTHQAQIWPLNIFTWLAYGKYDHGLHREGDFSIYTSVGAGTWGPPMRTFNMPEIVAIKLK